MNKVTALRLGTCVALFVLLEVLCRAGVITPFAMIPPTEMITALWALLASGKFNGQIMLTLATVVAAAAAAIAGGFAIAIVLHAWPRARRAVDPYLASIYAVPLFIFYPTFIMVFGLNRMPVVLIAFLKAAVVVIIATLDGLDRVPRIQRKVALVMKTGRWDTVFNVILPSAFPYFLTGGKFAIAYSFLGVLGSEFILANGGIGYEISFAFGDFDNKTMYALILLVLIIVSIANAVLFAWERSVLRRRGMA